MSFSSEDSNKDPNKDPNDIPFFEKCSLSEVVPMSFEVIDTGKITIDFFIEVMDNNVWKSSLNRFNNPNHLPKEIKHNEEEIHFVFHDYLDMTVVITCTFIFTENKWILKGNEDIWFSFPAFGPYRHQKKNISDGFYENMVEHLNLLRRMKGGCSSEEVEVIT